MDFDPKNRLSWLMWGRVAASSYRVWLFFAVCALVAAVLVAVLG